MSLTRQWEDELLMVERERLRTEQERLRVEQDRLRIEEHRLDLEKDRRTNRHQWLELERSRFMEETKMNAIRSKQFSLLVEALRGAFVDVGGAIRNVSRSIRY